MIKLKSIIFFNCIEMDEFSFVLALIFYITSMNYYLKSLVFIYMQPTPYAIEFDA